VKRYQLRDSIPMVWWLRLPARRAKKFVAYARQHFFIDRGCAFLRRKHAYRLNDYEIWAATSHEHAVQVAMQTCGLPRDDVYDEAYTERPLLQGSLEVLRVGYDDGTTRTLAELLREMQSPGLLCAFE
jgi:hypothetical protein